MFYKITFKKPFLCSCLNIVPPNETVVLCAVFGHKKYICVECANKLIKENIEYCKKLELEQNKVIEFNNIDLFSSKIEKEKYCKKVIDLYKEHKIAKLLHFLVPHYNSCNELLQVLKKYNVILHKKTEESLYNQYRKKF